MIRQALLAIALSSATIQPVLAEKADREKPITLEAARVNVDDIKKVQVYEGNVVLTQGTLVIRAERIVVTQDDDGFQKGVATNGAGGLARFRQKREGKDEFIEGEAERIEHNARTEKTEFFARAWVKSGLDEVRGNYISYDTLSEKYYVTSGLASDGKTPVVAEGGRVRAIIQSKKAPTEPPAGEPLTLKPSNNIPRKE